MNDWQSLMDSVIVGTQGEANPQGEYAGMTAAQALLKQLALAGVYRRAGLLPTTVKLRSEIDAPPPEKLPPCSFDAISWLRRLTESTLTQVLLPQWCLLVASRRRRIPHRHLSYALRLGNSRGDWAPFLLLVIGERGWWMINRSDGYQRLKEEAAQLALPDRPPLAPPEIPTTNTYLLELRQQMFEDLADE